MPTYKKPTIEAEDMCRKLMEQFHPLSVEAGVKVDLLFAFPDYDETTGEPTNDALKSQGYKCLGVARKVSLKDRTKGHGDAEITLDGDWWEKASEEEQRALLDHELQHLVATAKRDDLGRPILKMRKHDTQVGWFAVIAQRHGVHSQERKQAASIVEVLGQFYFPELLNQTGGRASRFEIQTQTK